jgi:hypothetical protein
MTPQHAQNMKVGNLVIWQQLASGSVTSVDRDEFTVRWDDGVNADYLFDDVATASMEIEKEFISSNLRRLPSSRR